jgi:hypothetical protein
MVPAMSVLATLGNSPIPEFLNLITRYGHGNTEAWQRGFRMKPNSHGRRIVLGHHGSKMRNRVAGTFSHCVAASPCIRVRLESLSLLHQVALKQHPVRHSRFEHSAASGSNGSNPPHPAI